MAVVQLYQGQQVRQTGTNQNIGVHASAESFGAGRARDLGRVAQGVMDVSELLLERQKKADAAHARDLLNRAQMEAQDAMQQGVYSRKGLDADGADEQARAAMDGIKKKYLALAKGRQKELFTSNFDEIANSNVLHAASHRDREMERGNLASMDAENQLAIERATSLRNTPDEIAKAEFTLRQNTLAANKGMGAAAELKAKGAVELLHRSVLSEHLAAGDDAKALAHIEKYGDRIPKDMAEKVQNGIAFRQQQGAVLEMVKGGKGEAEIAEYVMGSVKDPAKADDLVRYARTFIAVRERDQAAKVHQAVDGAWAKVEASGDPNDIDPRLPREDRHAMLRWLKENGGRDAAKEPDYEAFDNLMKLSPDELVKFAKRPGAMSEARLALGGEKAKEFQAFNARVIDAYGGKVDEKKKAEAEGFLSDQSLASEMFKAKYLPLAEDGKFDKKKEAGARSKFLVAYNQKLAEAQRQAGDKPLDLAAKQKIAGRMLLFGEWDKGIMTTGRNLFKYEVEQEGLDLADWQGEADTGAPKEIAGGREIVVDGQRFRRSPGGAEPELKVEKQKRQVAGGGGITIEGAK